MNHPVFSDRDGHRLKEIFSNANNGIEKYFIEEDGKVILQTIFPEYFMKKACK